MSLSPQTLGFDPTPQTHGFDPTPHETTAVLMGARADDSGSSSAPQSCGKAVRQRRRATPYFRGFAPAPFRVSGRPPFRPAPGRKGSGWKQASVVRLKFLFESPTGFGCLARSERTGGFAPSPPSFCFCSSVSRAGATAVYALRFLPPAARRHIMQRRAPQRTIRKFFTFQGAHFRRHGPLRASTSAPTS
jgi:hypothetical protein